MNGPERLKIAHGVVIWEQAGVSCTCLTLTPDNIEIRLVVNGMQVERQRFGDADSASRYAIEKMHAYNAT